MPNGGLSLKLEDRLEHLLRTVIVTVSLHRGLLGGLSHSRGGSGVGSVLGELLRCVWILEIIATVLVLIVTAHGLGNVLAVDELLHAGEIHHRLDFLSGHRVHEPLGDGPDGVEQDVRGVDHRTLEGLGEQVLESGRYVLHQVHIGVLALVSDAVDQKCVLGHVGRHSLLHVLAKPHQHSRSLFEVAVVREAVLRAVYQERTTLFVGSANVQLSRVDFF
mmetsp:Transcript_10403/g.18114  ORF Transcript_10403/g.18114 Transcript_10403/m.18114 type:complete len:219 (+) Transcript_10403:277-933(+)